jgi:hypothetical protein
LMLSMAVLASSMPLVDPDMSPWHLDWLVYSPQSSIQGMRRTFNVFVALSCTSRPITEPHPSRALFIRESVGKLPGRDRKIWNRAMHKRRMHSLQPNLELVDDGSTMYCQPVQYSSYRAWFGKPVEFRHDEQASLPVCEGDHYLLSNCTAIVALHPDKATDAIVDVAIQRQVPLVIVPCCVFFRLFPHRRRPGIDKPVSTHEDLLHFLSGKDPTIRRTTLPFEGANTILWSVF